MKKLTLALLFVASTVFGQSSRPPIDSLSQLQDVNVSAVSPGDALVWDGLKWVPGSAGVGTGLPSQGGQNGKFLITNGTSTSWSFPSFSSLTGVPTTAAGFGITGGTNIDLWGAITPYAGNLVITTGKTATISNTITISGTDGASLNIGAGGTLGSNALNSTAFVPQTTTVNGHALSGNVTVTKSDVSLGHLFIGSGSPEGAITAPVGSLYSRTDGGSGTSLYVKQSGSGNTGWTADSLSLGNLPTGGTVGQILVKNSGTDFDAAWAADPGGVGGSGSVLDVGVTTANGVSATTANATDHPRMTFSLGAITPTSVATSGTLTGSNLSGTNTGDQTITLTGAVTGAGTGSFATTLSNGSVTLAKLATFPANTILGNNTGSTTTPIAMSPTQAKSLLSLSVVENTALSTWVGSSNITTLGTITSGTVPAARLSGTLAAAQEPAHTGDMTNSAGSLVLTAAPNVVKESVQIGTNATNTWTSGVTNFIEGTNLTVSRQRTLPPTSGYADGGLIKYFDVVTTGAFGPLFLPAGSDTLKGTNAATWTSNGFYHPFIAAGYNGGGKSITFQKRSVNWEVYSLGGESLSITGLSDRVDPTKNVQFDISGVPHLSTKTVRITDGAVAVKPSTVSDGTFANGVDADGNILYSLPLLRTVMLSPTQVTSDQNDYAPTGFTGSQALRLTTNASRNITGLLAGNNGDICLVYNVGSFNVVLQSANTGSAAVNRFIFTGDITLVPNASTLLQYDGVSNRWRSIKP